MPKERAGAEPSAAEADTSVEHSARHEGVDDQQQRAVSPSPSTARLTTDKWAEIYFPASGSGRQHDELWKHAAAAQLHGWEEYRHQNAKPLELSEADYKAALAAACSNDLKPHPAADCRRKG